MQSPELWEIIPNYLHYWLCAVQDRHISTRDAAQITETLSEINLQPFARATSLEAKLIFSRFVEVSSHGFRYACNLPGTLLRSPRYLTKYAECFVSLHLHQRIRSQLNCWKMSNSERWCCCWPCALHHLCHWHTRFRINSRLSRSRCSCPVDGQSTTSAAMHERGWWK